MFRSGLTKAIYKGFLNAYHLNQSELENVPFVYADPNGGSIKLLTSLMSSKEIGAEIFAFSMVTSGGMELLSTE